MANVHRWKSALLHPVLAESHSEVPPRRTLVQQNLLDALQNLKGGLKKFFEEKTLKNLLFGYVDQNSGFWSPT